MQAYNLVTKVSQSNSGRLDVVMALGWRVFCEVLTGHTVFKLWCCHLAHRINSFCSHFVYTVDELVNGHMLPRFIYLCRKFLVSLKLHSAKLYPVSPQAMGHSLTFCCYQYGAHKALGKFPAHKQTIVYSWWPFGSRVEIGWTRPESSLCTNWQ